MGYTASMRRVGLLVGITVLSGAAAFACDDSSTSPDTPGLDAGGGNLESGTGGPTPAVDSGTVAPVIPDAATASDGGGDAGGPMNALFAHIDQKLVKVDTTTGALTDVGATAQEWIVLAWDDTAKVARVVIDPYSPVGGAGTPKLGTIDLCNGTITVGPAITLDGAPVRRVEAIAQHPTTGVWFIGFGTSGTGAATEFLSERNGTVDVASGNVTGIGTHQTHQDDADNFTFVGTTLRLLDVATTNNTGSLYVLDQTTGAASAPVTTGPALLRVSYDKTRDVVFTAFGIGTAPNTSQRGIGTLNLTTGANTPLGAALAAGTYGNVHFNGLVSAPTPTCPP